MESTSTFLITTLWDILKNVLGNRADAALFPKEIESELPPAQRANVTAESDVEPARTFRTFDAINDFVHIVPLVDQPVVHLLIESEPSTFYNLAAFVVESRTTGQWYLFARGRIALEGSGGGKNNLDSLVDQLRSQNTPIAAWVIDHGVLSNFESGIVLWSTVRSSIVPLLAYMSQSSDSWPGIRNRFRELATSAA